MYNNRLNEERQLKSSYTIVYFFKHQPINDLEDLWEPRVDVFAKKFVYLSSLEQKYLKHAITEIYASESRLLHDQILMYGYFLHYTFHFILCC